MNSLAGLIRPGTRAGIWHELDTDRLLLDA